MPTIPLTADKLPPAYSPVFDLIDTSNMLQNTTPFDLYGHPAFSISCGLAGGLPVGLRLVGRTMDNAIPASAAQALATTYDRQRGLVL